MKPTLSYQSYKIIQSNLYIADTYTCAWTMFQERSQPVYEWNLIKTPLNSGNFFGTIGVRYIQVGLYPNMIFRNSLCSQSIHLGLFAIVTARKLTKMNELGDSASKVFWLAECFLNETVSFVNWTKRIPELPPWQNMSKLVTMV